MKKTLKLLSLIIFMYSCQTEVEKQKFQVDYETTGNQTNIESEFSVICKTLPVIELPYAVYCEDCCIYPVLTKKQEEITRYLPEGSSLLGIIEMNNSFSALLITYPADLMIPAVITFDLQGKKIGEEVFLGGYCGNDFEYRGQNHFAIQPDLTLIETDTSYYFKRDPESFDIMDTLNVEIETKKFRLNKQGEIVPFLLHQPK